LRRLRPDRGDPPTDTTVHFLKVDLHFANLASDFDLYLIDAERPSMRYQ
jgi:hypothetical protein